MEEFYLQLILCHLILLSLLLVSSLDFSVASDPLFINCGSKSIVEVDGRNFTGDDQGSHLFEGGSKSARNSSLLPADTSPLYQTVRIFNQLSYYELQIPSNGIYLVRLHFFPFIHGGTNLSDALFNVSTSKLLLLSVRNAGDFEGIVKEYFLNITAGKLLIYFVPAKESFAFVNAIEVIPLPPKFFTNHTFAIPPLSTANGTLFLQSNAFQTIYRVNVGGPEVNRSNDDSLWRHWVGDDQFLVSKASAKNCSQFFGPFKKNPGIADVVEHSAPEIVYRTCKQMNSNSNITWHFNVRKKVMHFIRLHFCDFLSPALGTLQFNLYIYSNFRWSIDPSSNYTVEAPFLYDLVVDSDESGYINISVGPQNDSTKIDAFLNGVEIMEFVTNTMSLNETISHSAKHTGIKIGLSVGAVASFAILIVLFLFLARQRRASSVQAVVLKDAVPQGRDRPHSWITAIRDSSASPLPTLNLKLRMPLSEILAATNNFDTKLLIGEGGFGKVYKGTLSDGKKVAVKRSDSSHGQGLPEFQTEVTVLSKIRHRHLVSLFGYCDEGSEMILVYEFMEKGTLRDHLYIWKGNSENASAIPRLTWKQRLEICIGAAKGLHYLHTGSEGGIIHRDVKSTNILLDENYVAKVADFGLSQSGPPDPEHYNLGLIGSFGYLDPEYVRTYQLTYKSDVYSFGVVLLELLCARPPIVDSSMREEMNLAEWGMFWHRKGQLEKIVDPLLAGQINLNSLRKFVEITERCLNTEGAQRPAMLDVTWDLEYALQLQQTSVPRDPHDDSTTDVSSSYVFPASSTYFPSEEGYILNGNDDELDSKLVFSRSMFDGPR